MESQSTSDLILELQAGRHDALGALYDRYNRLVFHTAVGITGDSEAAADMMQEAFLRLYRYVERIDSERPLEPWLARVTANLSYTWVRRRRWLQPLEDVAEWFAGEKKYVPHHAAEIEEEWRQVEDAIQSLPLSQRVVITLYYINDFSLKEITEILDIPAGTVKSRLHYGRLALKNYISSRESVISAVQYDFT